MSEASDRAAAAAERRAAAGVDDWRMLGSGLHARWRVGSLVAAAEFGRAVAHLAADAPRPVGIDLRAETVTVLIPDGEARFGEPERRLAAAVQQAARERGLQPDPDSLRSVQIAVAAAPGVDVRQFWRGILGYEPLGADDARDPADRTPPLWFHGVERAGRGRTHIDVYLPAEQAEAVVTAAVEAGGRIAEPSKPPHWWTIASPDNHGIDIAPWPDQEWLSADRPDGEPPAQDR